MEEKRKKGKQFLILVLLTFLVPPASWLGQLGYSTLLSFDEIVSLVISPYMIGYILIFVSSVFIYASKKINIIIELFEKKRLDENELALQQRTIARLPREIIFATLLYCVIGPMVAMISQDFIDKTEWIIALLFGIPLILLFAVPFYFKFIAVLEDLTQDVPLSKEHKAISVKLRIYIASLFTVVGIIISLSSFSYAIVYEAAKDADILGLLVSKLLGFSIAAISIAFFNLMMMGNVISSHMVKMADKLSKLADGDLTQTVAKNVRDETGQLIESFNNVSFAMRSIINSIAKASADVSNSSSEISSGNNQLNSSTQEMASSLTETAASVEEISSSIENTAKVSVEAAKSIGKTAEEATEGAKMLEQMVQATNNAKESGNKITEIVDVVNEIAFQTNLLALNAAVEAARAGEMGKGFAVVANEVRGLAARSAEASAEIKSLVDENKKNIELTTSLSKDTSKTLTMVIQKIQSANNTMQIIQSRAGEQASGIKQVNSAVGKMEQVTQKNASLVEELASAAENMARLSVTLSDKIGSFRTS